MVWLIACGEEIHLGSSDRLGSLSGLEISMLPEVFWTSATPGEDTLGRNHLRSPLGLVHQRCFQVLPDESPPGNSANDEALQDRLLACAA